MYEVVKQYKGNRTKLGKSSRLPDLVCSLRRFHSDFCLACLILSWQYNREAEFPAMFSMWEKQMLVSYVATRGCGFYKWEHKNTLLAFYFPSQHIAASHYFIVLTAYGIRCLWEKDEGYIRHRCLDECVYWITSPGRWYCNIERHSVSVLMEIQKSELSKVKGNKMQ